MATYELHHGDCLDWLPTLAAGSVDAVICDEPYGTTQCAWDSPIPFVPMWAELKRLVKPRAAIVLFGSQPFTSALVMSNVKWFRYEWVWEKDRATGALSVNHLPLKAHENIIVFSREPHKYYPQKTTGHPIGNASSARAQAGRVYREYERQQYIGSDERFPRSVQRFNTVNSAHKPAHPTQKPRALMEYLVKTYTHEGDTVLDFTMGSGTTGEACLNTGRNFIGIEKDAAYFDIATKRLAAFAAQPRQLAMPVEV